MPIQAPTKATPSSPSPQAPSRGTGNTPQKANQPGDEQKSKRQQTPQEQPKQKKFGLLMMLWCLFWAAIYDIVGLILAIFLLDDFGIADTIYFALVTLPLFVYCWVKGIPRTAWFLMGWLFELIPYLALILPQILYLFIIFRLTNSKSKKAQALRTVGSKLPSPKGGGSSMGRATGPGR